MLLKADTCSIRTDYWVLGVLMWLCTCEMWWPNGQPVGLQIGLSTEVQALAKVICVEPHTSIKNQVPVNCQGCLTKQPALDQHPIQGGVKILLVNSCYRCQDKLRQLQATRLMKTTFVHVNMMGIMASNLKGRTQSPSVNLRLWLRMIRTFLVCIRLFLKWQPCKRKGLVGIQRPKLQDAHLSASTAVFSFVWQEF